MNNKNEKACCFKTSVGGQALMEGVMMRGPQKMCVAVRQPDGEIFTEVSPIRTHPWQKWPFVREYSTLSTAWSRATSAL